MSHAEVINYGAIGLQCNAICNLADKELVELDRLIDYLEKSSSSLQTSKVKEMEEHLRQAKNEYNILIESYRVSAQQLSTYGSRARDLEYDREQFFLQTELRKLKKSIADLSVNQIPLLRKMIDEEVHNVANKTIQDALNKAVGVVQIDELFEKQLLTINDLSLREAVYRCAIETNIKIQDFNELIVLGKERIAEMQKSMEVSHREKLAQKIRKDMEAARLDSKLIEDTIEASNDINQLKEKAMDEIINEEVRLESVKIILKAIESRGFIVDRKNNIKIDREKNEVKLLAQRANGQTAEFKVFLDGKFIYHFDGFEGQACQQDIQPFLSDLEDVYGLQITGRVDIWSNPDKLSSQKYQAINTNKGTK